MRKSLLFISLSVAFSQQSFGQPNADSDTSNTIDSVVVEGTRSPHQIDSQRITEQYIRSQPKNNGTLNELLRNNPNVQFSNSNKASESLGEISPENVSIHGQPFYSNNWVLDGVSNNNNLNPGKVSGVMNGAPGGNNPTSLPDGNPQNFFVSSDLISSVEVIDSNISAKYGQFTGGVIDAKIKDPSPSKVSGSIFYRTTRDSWTKFHIDDKIKDDFEDASFLQYQPKFTKHSYGMNVNIPINNRTAILLSYDRIQSKIPFHHNYYDKWENQTRRSETFMAKGLHEAENGDVFKLTAMYSPHQSKFFATNDKGSGYTNTGGGYNFNATWDHKASLGILKSQISYTQTQNEIDHGEYSKYVWRPSANIDWSSSKNLAREGGYGKFDTSKKTFTLKQDFDFNKLNLGSTEHNISLGWKADFAKASYNRDRDIFMYSPAFKPKNGSSVVCIDGDKSCIAGDQFQKLQIKYPALHTKIKNDHYAFYLQDHMTYKRLEITPGVRIDYDKFLKNTNVAPRLSLSYDVFGNKNTVLFGGLNRYYSDSILAYALSANTKRMIRSTRTKSNQPFKKLSETNNSFASDNLKTPYSDEINLGIKQNIANTEWVFKWVNRKGKDQFTYNNHTIDKVNWNVLNNNGTNKSNTFTLSGRLTSPITLGKVNLSSDWGASYLKSKTNFNNYDQEVDIEKDNEKVIINGKLIDRRDMPALNFNNPWNLFANINFDFPQYRFNWNNHIVYTAGYTAYKSKSVKCPAADSACGGYTGEAYLYEKTRFKPRLSLDWNFNYRIPIAKTDLNISLDVLNVFNSKIASASSSGIAFPSYQAGRQFWLGARYQW